MNSPEGPEVGGDFDDEYLATLVEQCEGMGGEDDLIAELAHEVRRMRAQPCPHVVAGDEGTAYCDLAESSVRALRERVAAFEAVDPWQKVAWQRRSPVGVMHCVGCRRPRKDGHEPECPWGGGER